MGSARHVDPERALVPVEPIALHDGARAEGRVRYLRKDRPRVDRPAVDEPRPEKEVVYRGHDALRDKEPGVLDEEWAASRDLRRDDRAPGRIAPGSGQRYAPGHDAKRIDDHRREHELRERERRKER